MYEGGSIRVPAAFNYLYGIRPSHGRMPYARLANSMEGQETIHSVVGPVAHSAAGQSCTLNTMKNELTKKKNGTDLRLFITSVLGEEPWNYDPKVIPLPWNKGAEEEAKKKIKSGLNLGFFNCDGNVICIYCIYALLFVC